MTLLLISELDFPELPFRVLDLGWLVSQRRVQLHRQSRCRLHWMSPQFLRFLVET